MTRWLLLIGSLVTMTCVGAQESVELRLTDAIALALRDNRAVRGAYLQRVVQRFDLRVAVDQFAPQLSLHARYLGQRNQADRYRQAQLTPSASLLTPYGTRLSLDWAYDDTRADDAGRRYSDGANLTIIQPLLRGAGRAIATAPLRQAHLAEQINRLALQESVAQVVAQTIFDYHDLLRAQEQLRIADDALARARQWVEVNRALIAAGRMPAFEIVQAQAQVADQELAREGSRNRLYQSRLALAQVLALDMTTPLRAVEPLRVEPTHLDAEQALQRAQRLQPAYRAQLLAGEQAAIDLQVARNEQWWDLALIGGASQQRERPVESRAWQHYLGLELSIPLGDLSRRQVLVQAQVAADTQRLREAQAQQQLARDVAVAVRDLQVRWRQLGIARRALELAQRKLDIEQEKLAAGRSSNFQVLSFESDLRQAQSTELDTSIDYLQAQVMLDQVVGSTLQRWQVALDD
ncbi:TolC family protein [Pseudomonas sp. URMO17WK12:I11]|uniref:TolC family protein n=1 Tax=Pseudomonas sp. URMO17WK12:I11 TaxID=1283291 RepID=UPI0011A03956|nr:TolC family protein [Pseudomonas sp. URMO17WK12:I11]